MHLVALFNRRAKLVFLLGHGFLVLFFFSSEELRCVVAFYILNQFREHVCTLMTNCFRTKGLYS